MNSLSRTALITLALLCCSLPACAAGLTVMNLQSEYRVNPLGLDVVKPRLSWTLASNQRGEKQTAYQILVATSPDLLLRNEGDLWDTGKFISDQTAQVVYDGQPLRSRMRAWWKVRVWDQNAKPSTWSAPATWTMGLLQPSDWRGKWIADPNIATNAAVRGPLNGYHSELAQSADAVKWVEVDLGRTQSFDAIRLFPARPYDFSPDTPGFLFPVRFKIEAAVRADFADAWVLLDRTTGDEPNPGTNAPLYRFAPTTARFIRLTVTRLQRRDANNFGFALAEMQVLNGETNLAKGAKVLALDSTETGPWAKVNLTDGVLVMVKPSGADSGALPATMFHKSFQLDRPIKRATAYTTALGLYELHLNGQRVGDQLLAPAWTDYHKRVQYQVYDVTALLRQGDNTVAALLGEGRYAGRVQDAGRFAYGRQPRFLLQLEIEFADGQTQTIVSDGSWRCTTNGPIRSAGIYDGETYDARKEMPGWDAPGFDASSWRPAASFDLDSRRLVWQCNEPIQVEKELKPVKMTELKPGVFVFDFGQNMVGWCHVKAVGAAGQTVTIRHAETLNDDGTLYTNNLRGAQQIDRYIPRADGRFVFEPHFTYHGFRYVELTGLARPPAKAAVLGLVFHSACPVVGRFECSDPSLNRLMQNILWTQRANLMSVPTDCPQRDERMGWMGDIQAFSQTAIFNMDMAAFFTKFAQDIRDAQAQDGRFPDYAPHPVDLDEFGAPGWADAGVIIPWRVYQNYADTRILASQFEAARRWVDYIHRNNPDLIWANSRGHDYGDWLNGDWIKQAGWPSEGGAVSNVIFATAFFAHSTELVAKMAGVLGRKEDARRYGELFDQIKAAFNQRFVKPDGRIEGDTQGGYALALNFNLLPDDLRSQAAQYLVEGIRHYHDHLSTGIQASSRAMLELARNNYTDVSWQLLTNRTFPSWLYMIDNGATTIWERWDAYVKGRGFQNPGMNSLNHWALGAVGEWMWRNIAGLNPDDAQPGWKHFVIAPEPGGGVTWAKNSYDSIRGRISSKWHQSSGQFDLQITIPPNTTATVYLPAKNIESITESGRPLAKITEVTSAQMQANRAVLEIGSGSYHFVSNR